MHLFVHTLIDNAAKSTWTLIMKPVRPDLSDAELNCLALISNGTEIGEIAMSLSLSFHAVQLYLAMAARKLDATNPTHAVARAMRLGLID